jgi:PLD-like domain
MARIVTTKGISAAISDVISRADKRVVIISPYIQLSPLFEERLLASGQRGVELIIVCRKKKLKEEEKDKLLRIPNVKLYAHDNVHTKCYYNERELVLGSMNFYEYSDKYNRELGITIEAVNDKQLYDDAVRESEEIVLMAMNNGDTYRSTVQPKPAQTTHQQTQTQTGNTQAQSQQKKSEPQKKEEAKPRPSYKQNFNIPRPDKRNFLEKIADVLSHQGFCLRCKTKLQYNPNTPYCPSCYKSWAQWNNIEFKERYCHRCGESNPTSLSKPLCKHCYANGR